MRESCYREGEILFKVSKATDEIQRLWKGTPYKGIPVEPERGPIIQKKILEGCYSWTDDDSAVPKGNKYLWTQPLQRGINGIQVKKSTIHGRGVFANKTYYPDSDIAYFDGYVVDHDTRHSLTLAGRKIEPTGPLIFLNHSCDPSCYFKDRTLVAKREINASAELTINYLNTEDHLSRSFKCNCRCTSCTKKSVR